LREHIAEGDDIDTRAHVDQHDEREDFARSEPPGSPQGEVPDTAPEAAFKGWGRSEPARPRRLSTTLGTLIADQPEWALWIECLALVFLVGLADFVTGTELSFSIFYVGPIVFAAWFISRRAGVAAALLSVALWAWLDMRGGAVYSSTLIPVWNSAVRLGFYFTALELVARTKTSAERERVLARTDSLTGVANGRAFADRARLALSYVRRAERPVTIAYIDLDHFKEVNDSRGHSEGDHLLHAVAQAVAGRLRSTDLVARLGGDEFGVLLGDTDAAMAPKVLAVIREAINEAVDGKWGVGCTIGAVTFTAAPPGVDFMVRAADELMYRGKKEGRDRIVHEVWPGE
jgi:diguanylate cyclase (GGDEF)-like protein